VPASVQAKVGEQVFGAERHDRLAGHHYRDEAAQESGRVARERVAGGRQSPLKLHREAVRIEEFDLPVATQQAQIGGRRGAPTKRRKRFRAHR
jgi:hypothetical protein